MYVHSYITTVPFLLYKICNKLVEVYRDFVFLLFRKPFYMLFYNLGGNSFQCKGKLRRTKVLLTGRGNLVLIEEGVLLNKVQIEISGKDNKLIIRKGVTFAEGGRIRIEDERNTIEIDEDAKMINCFLSSADKATRMYIGKNCLFSADVIIRTSDAHSIIIDGTTQRINKGDDVKIGEHVWICNGTRVMKGSSIGKNCIIGSNTLVSGQKIEDNCLVVGNPCKVVKTGVNWSNKRF